MILYISCHFDSCSHLHDFDANFLLVMFKNFQSNYFLNFNDCMTWTQGIKEDTRKGKIDGLHIYF